jgi:hypothetical protein
LKEISSLCDGRDSMPLSTFVKLVASHRSGNLS